MEKTASYLFCKTHHFGIVNSQANQHMYRRSMNNEEIVSPDTELRVNCVSDAEHHN